MKYDQQENAFSIGLTGKERTAVSGSTCIRPIPGISTGRKNSMNAMTKPRTATN